MAVKSPIPFIIALTIYSAPPNIKANGDEPKFQDYQVESVFTGANHRLEEKPQSDKKWQKYREDAAKRKVNFAGHYVLYTGDCGGGAICGEIFDAATGRIVDGFPNAYELDSTDGSYYDAGYRQDSRLLVISGAPADPEKDQAGNLLPRENRIRYFELNNGKLILIKIQRNLPK